MRHRRTGSGDEWSTVPGQPHDGGDGRSPTDDISSWREASPGVAAASESGGNGAGRSHSAVAPHDRPQPSDAALDAPARNGRLDDSAARTGEPRRLDDAFAGDSPDGNLSFDGLEEETEEDEEGYSFVTGQMARLAREPSYQALTRRLARRRRWRAGLAEGLLLLDVGLTLVALVVAQQYRAVLAHLVPVVL
ncbi:MAG TPA: hypothetical protein VF818_02550, partial [Ktedonobacterales bacterium]